MSLLLFGPWTASNPEVLVWLSSDLLAMMQTIPAQGAGGG